MVKKYLKSFLLDRRGSFALQGALAMTTVLLSVGFALDYMSASRYKGQLQQAADAAALGAARDATMSVNEIRDLAQQIFFANFSESFGSQAPNLSATVTRQDGTNTYSVSVHVSVDVPTTLMRLANIDSVEVAAYARARYSSTFDGACVIALDPGNKQGSMLVQGAGTVNVPNCGVFVNSSHTQALRQQGGGQFRAKDIWVVGGRSNGNYSPVPLTGQKQIADPLLHIPEPTAPAICSHTNRTFTGNNTFSDGTVFCGNITFNGNARFQGNIQYFKNASVSAASDANIISNGAMLYFDENSSISKSSGTGRFQLTAPNSGIYRGIAIFGSRKITGSIRNFEFYGNKDFNVHGAVYLPRAHWFMTGSTEMNVTSENGWLIAWHITYHGSSALTLDTFGGPAPVGMADEAVVLVK